MSAVAYYDGADAHIFGLVDGEGHGPPAHYGAEAVVSVDQREGRRLLYDFEICANVNEAVDDALSIVGEPSNALTLAWKAAKLALDEAVGAEAGLFVAHAHGGEGIQGKLLQFFNGDGDHVYGHAGSPCWRVGLGFRRQV